MTANRDLERIETDREFPMKRYFRLLSLFFLLLLLLTLLRFHQELLSLVDSNRGDFLSISILIILVCSILLFGTRTFRTLYGAYQVHRTLLDVEMNISEIFARIKPASVDKRRDRMVEVMTAAETCKLNTTAMFVVNSNKDKGASQETARSIIDRDFQEMTSFRNNKRGARINAFAFEALLRGQFKAARNHILTKQKEAIQKGRDEPAIISALARLLNIPQGMDLAKVEDELTKDNPLGLFPVKLHLAIKLWKHPTKMRYRKGDRVYLGWDALEDRSSGEA